MCKKGIACSYNQNKGRISNIRINKSENNIVGDFLEEFSQHSQLVAISSIEPLHNKAQKLLDKEAAPLREKLEAKRAMAV